MSNEAIMDEKRRAQIGVMEKCGEYFSQLAAEQFKRAGMEEPGSRDVAWCNGAAFAFLLAKNACEIFIHGSEAEAKGLGVLEWTDKGFRLTTNKEGEE